MFDQVPFSSIVRPGEGVLVGSLINGDGAQGPLCWREQT